MTVHEIAVERATGGVIIGRKVLVDGSELGL